MPSPTKENYLKAIYHVSDKDGRVSISDLSKEMNVSYPTTNSMVKNLKEIGWVKYEKYKPLQLTDKGKKAAALIIRKHRIAEMYLVEKMGFGWEEVHDIAEEMEHIGSESLFDRMHELLDSPEVDPHGSPIPQKSGEMPANSYLRLSEIEAGKKVDLKALERGSTELMLYLNRKNIKLGTRLEVLRIEPYDNSMEVAYDNVPSMTLSEEICDQLLVE